MTRQAKEADAPGSAGRGTHGIPANARFDLHLHTTASDGAQAPGEVVALASECGLYGLSVTDHDTLSGLREAGEAAAALGLLFLPGVEVSAGGDAEVHILGYGVSEGRRPLAALFEKLKQERIERFRQMLRQCRQLGIAIDWEEQAFQGESIGRVHLAEAMVRQGHAASVREAFDRYLQIGKPCYAARPPFAVRDAILQLRKNGAVPVLAHPGQLRMGEGALTACLPGWLDAGLMGIEVYHPSHLPHTARIMARLAKRYNLLVTGGSDAHGGQDRAAVGTGISNWKNAGEDVARLLDRLAALYPEI